MRLRGPKLLATKYEKPPKIGSIFVNPAWRRDNSRSLWEVVESNDASNDALGAILEAGWILVTPPNSGVYLWHDSEHREVFILAASSVRRIIPWTTETEDMQMKGKRLLVKRDEPKKQEGRIVVPETSQKRPTTGVIVEVADDVVDKSLEAGVRVLYSLYVGVDVEVDGVKMTILDESQVMATLDDEEVAA